MVTAHNRAATGIEGLDAILGGGLVRNRLYLIEGAPGAGKTTLGLQFAISGARAGESSLYMTTSESAEEICEIARSHGWSLEGVRVHHHAERLSPGSGQTIFHPVEVELPKTIEALVAIVDEAKPARIVFDSLSEVRTLAREEHWYRRQLMSLRDHFVTRRSTVLLLDESDTAGMTPVRSIVSGVIFLERHCPDYGPARRRLEVTKMRGQTYATGYHDFEIQTGGLRVFPRLIAAEHRADFAPELVSSGLPEMDVLLGGGLSRGTNAALIGPTGAGKSIVAAQYVAAAAARGERSAIYIFDERPQTLYQRCQGMGFDLRQHVEDGTVLLQQIDPSELTAGAFTDAVVRAVTEREVRLVVVDSINGYLQAMGNNRLVAVHMHELLTYLSQSAVTSIVVVSQTGLPGSAGDSPIDISYLADTVVLLRPYEFSGHVRKSISVYKHRTGPHESTIRDLKIGATGLQIGPPLTRFQGVLSGQPVLMGGRGADPV